MQAAAAAIQAAAKTSGKSGENGSFFRRVSSCLELLTRLRGTCSVSARPEVVDGRRAPWTARGVAYIVSLEPDMGAFYEAFGT